jgi:hypothetical protein
MKLIVNPVKIEIYDEEMHGHVVATAGARAQAGGE